MTDESLRTLDVVDAKTLKVTKRIPLSGRPNNVAVAKDDSWVYVGIVEAPGAVDVIDTAAMVKVKSIAVKGGIHNVYVTPDGKWAVAGSIPSSTISVIDTATNTLDVVDDDGRGNPADGVHAQCERLDERDHRAAFRFSWLRGAWTSRHARRCGA